MDRELENIIKDIDENKLEDLTSSKIKEYKNNILQKMGLEGSMVKKYHKILKDYKYVDEIDELIIGRYIRWFNLNDLDNHKLYNGLILTNIEYKNQTIVLICKNFRNQFFNIKMNESLIFQKMTYKEQLLIQILDQIEEK